MRDEPRSFPYPYRAVGVASITEVRQVAGVSVATASRVVSASDYPVSAATRERVLDAARELDYVPNALARGLLKSRVPVVGVIVHDITDPDFAEVVRGVEDAATGSGYLVITCSSERDAEREREYIRLLRSMQAAAVVFAGSGLDDPGPTRRSPGTWPRCAPTARRSCISPRTRTASRTWAWTTRPASARW